MSKEPYKFYEMKCPYCDNIVTELLEQTSNTKPFKCPSCNHILSLYGTFGYNMWLSANKKAKKCKERPINTDWINDFINKQKEQSSNNINEKYENMFIENDSEENISNEHVENIKTITDRIKNLLSSMGYKNIQVSPEFYFNNSNSNLNANENFSKEFKEYVDSINEQTHEIALVSLAQHNSFIKMGFTHEESMNLLYNLINSNSLFPKLND